MNSAWIATTLQASCESAPPPFVPSAEVLPSAPSIGVHEPGQTPAFTLLSFPLHRKLTPGVYNPGEEGSRRACHAKPHRGPTARGGAGRLRRPVRSHRSRLGLRGSLGDE